LAHQADILQKPWSAMLVVDAARPDYVRQQWPQFETVKAIGGITHMWFANLWQLCRGPMIVFSANPIVGWKQKRMNARSVEIVDVWRDCWRDFGTGDAPLGSVHPSDMNGRVRAWVEGPRGKVTPKIVVLYLQPHTPYIGKVRLPMAVGNLHDGLTGKGHDKDILSMIRADRLTWKQVRAAYKSNLELVMPHALELASWLGKHLEDPVIVTADHGEALGESAGRGGPQFGHAGVPYGLIRDVPLWRS